MTTDEPRALLKPCLPETLCDFLDPCKSHSEKPIAASLRLWRSRYNGDSRQDHGALIMELIIKLAFGAIGFGTMSWLLWDFASSHDTGLMLMAVILGLVAFVHGFLALAKIIHYSKWRATIFWVGMLGTLAYTFPVFGFSQIGWLGWGITAFLAVGSLFIVTYQPMAGTQSSGVGVSSSPFDEEGFDEGMHYTGYPTAEALRRGLD